MKVSTDACLQGAWTPIGANVKQVLDAGAGTGLLSLMLAQRNHDIEIDAIELDDNAANQAKENILNSPWAERINVINADIRNYNFKRKYDFILCNPPFFQNSLLGDNVERNNARHTLTLNYTDIIMLMENVLADDGYASVLLPYTELERWQDLLNDKGWPITKQLIVQPRAELKANRVVTICSRKQEGFIDERLTIYTQENKYSGDAVKLLAPFYLNL